jgi:hypothetical protein
MRHDYGTLLSVCRALDQGSLKLGRPACLKLVDQAPAPSEASGIDTRRHFRSRAAEFTLLAIDLMKVKMPYASRAWLKARVSQ